MNRRTWMRIFASRLSAAGSFSLLGQNRDMALSPNLSLIKPPVLRPGDTVGLITPATYVSDPDRLQLVAHTIEYFGLKPKWAKNVRRRSGYLGGTIGERLDDLHAMFGDPEVKAVFAVRGGYGSAQ